MQLRQASPFPTCFFALTLVNNPVWRVLQADHEAKGRLRKPVRAASAFSTTQQNLQCSKALGVEQIQQSTPLVPTTEHEPAANAESGVQRCLQLWEDLSGSLDWIGATDDDRHEAIFLLRRMGLHGTEAMAANALHSQHHLSAFRARHANLTVEDLSHMHSTQKGDWIWYRRARPHACVAAGLWKDASGVLSPRYVIRKKQIEKLRYGTGAIAECAIYDRLHNHTASELEWQVAPHTYCPAAPPRSTYDPPKTSGSWRLDQVDYCKALKGHRVLYVGDSTSATQFEGLLMLLSEGNYTFLQQVGTSPGRALNVSVCAGSGSISWISNDLLWEPSFSTEQKYPPELPLYSLLRKNDKVRMQSFLTDLPQYDVLLLAVGAHWVGKVCGCAEGKYYPCVTDERDPSCFARGGNPNITKNAFSTYKAKWMSRFHEIALRIRAVVPPSAKIFYRTPNEPHFHLRSAGHPGEDQCSGSSRPLKSRVVYRAGDGYGGDEVQALADTFFEAFEAAMPRRLHYIDARELSNQRIDLHRAMIRLPSHWSKDCLHYCLPSVVDDWNDVFMRLLWQASVKNNT